MENICYFDAHCDTVHACYIHGASMRQNNGQADFERGRMFARWAQVFALYENSSRAPEDGMFALLKREHAFFETAMAENADLAVHCRTAEETESANSQGKIAAILSIEGAELLDCAPENLQMAADWGVRCINITWNHANALSGTNVEQTEQGLTAQGREFVREMYRLGILPDVSHLSDRGFWDIVEMGLGPVIASHSNLRGICGHTRNLTDDQFKAVAASGGGVGLNLYVPFVGEQGSLDEFCRHIDRALELGGADCLGIGADLDGCDRIVAGMSGVQDIPDLHAMLRKRGYEEKLLGALFYSNLLHILLK